MSNNGKKGRNPPEKYRFKKGKSGNPKGRPKQTRLKLPHSLNPFLDEVERIFGEPVPVSIGGKRKKIPLLRALLKKRASDAISGDAAAQKELLRIAAKAGEQIGAERLTVADNVERYKQRWEPKFEAAEKAGLPEPTDLPHPAHINYSLETNQIAFSGPLNRAEKEVWDLVKKSLRGLNERRVALEVRLEAGVASDKDINELVEMRQTMMAIEKQHVPPGWDWRECVTDVDRAYFASLEDRSNTKKGD